MEPKGSVIVAGYEAELAEAESVRDIDKALGPEQIGSKILKSAFLIAFGKYGTVVRAQEQVARDLGVLPSRLRITQWARKDAKFRQQLVLASEEAADRLEAAAIERGVDGWEEPVYQRGELVGSVRKYSDTLLAMLLKGAKPAKYRDVVGVQHETASERRDALNKEMARLSLVQPVAQIEEAEIVSPDVTEPPAPVE